MGPEMAFTLLAGHLTYMSHLLFTVLLRYPVALALDAWRTRYADVHREDMPTIQSLAVPFVHETEHATEIGEGWVKCKRTKQSTVYWSPLGETFHTHEAAKKNAETLADVNLGASDRDAIAEIRAAQTELSNAGYSTVVGTTTQFHQYLHRVSDDPDYGYKWMSQMCLYLYTMWVYPNRSTLPVLVGHKRMKQVGISDLKAPDDLHVFYRGDFIMSTGNVQRIQNEFRVPLLEDFFIPTPEADPEQNAMCKCVLFMPYEQPMQNESGNPFDHIITPPHTVNEQTPQWTPETAWSYAWTRYLGKQQRLAKIADKKMKEGLREWPSLWQTREVMLAMAALDELHRTSKETPGTDGVNGKPDLHDHHLTLEEYQAWLVCDVAMNIDLIAGSRRTQQNSPIRARANK